MPYFEHQNECNHYPWWTMYQNFQSREAWTLCLHHRSHWLQCNPSLVGAYVLFIFLPQQLMNTWIYEWIASLNQVTSLKFVDPGNEDGYGERWAWVMKTALVCSLRWEHGTTCSKIWILFSAFNQVPIQILLQCTPLCKIRKINAMFCE